MNDETSHDAGAHSRELYARAVRVIPGGVSSPVRAFRAVGGTPRFIARGAGQYVYDVDGHRYLDLVNSWGALILGHAPPRIVDAVTRACRDGTTFGAPCAAEVELAERIVASYPGLEQVRFVSSGTEAVMSAIRVARAASGRDLIVKFSGCYHGHADHLLVAAGSGAATFGQPSSAGVPAAFLTATRVLPLDDEPAVQALFATEGARVAAVIIEPMPANHGLLPQRVQFLKLLRDATARHGALLIFDEVISGFRLARGGVAELTGITPDMATFGKVIGGGMPVGAFGGTRHLMANLAPEGPAYQAGTLSGNPVAMAAGVATLDLLRDGTVWERLEELGMALEEALAPVLARAPFALRLVRAGSLFWLAFCEGEAPRQAVTLDAKSLKRFAALFHAMLAHGVYLPPSAYEVCFLSAAFGEHDIQFFADALRLSLPIAAQSA
jgi:glutamate-1-semialdehyde 2,1-aminomutase